MARAILAAMLVGSFVASARADDAATTHFEAKVRPLLAEHCWRCHGPEKQKGGLRLDSAAAIAKGGDLGPVVVPGKPGESPLVEAIRYDGDLKMPPKGKLDDAEVAAVATWIAQGARWPVAVAAAKKPETSDASSASDAVGPERDRDFWAFQPPSETTPPSVSEPAWSNSPIDRFIRSGLTAKGLRPAPPADKRALIRRATFDLTGLPPTPAEVAAFLGDDAPDAFARVVDRLLASSRYGERWGRHWLDLARYADSNGMDENVAYANAWRYRDYVISAFNKDKPYDQFVREQIAGDLLPAADDRQRHEQVTATGFLVLGPKMLAEDDPLKMEMDIIDEQVDTVGKVFLGLTLGCARCHDHKFDPIPTADYYSLAGIFKSTKSMANHKVVAMWHEEALAGPSERDALAAHHRRVEANAKAARETTARARAALGRDLRKRAGAYLLAAREARRRDLVLEPLPTTDESRKAPGILTREAENLTRGNVIVDRDQYGPGIGVILNGGPTPNFAEYEFDIKTPALFQVELRYAAAESRPVRVTLDGKTLAEDAAAAVTGSWTPESQTWTIVGLGWLGAGTRVLRIDRDEGPIPHFDKIALIPRDVPEGFSVEPTAAEANLNPRLIDRWKTRLNGQEFAPGTALGAWLVDPSATADSLQRDLDRAGKASELALVGDDRLAAIRRLIDAPDGPLVVPKKVESYFPPETARELARLKAENEELDKNAPAVPEAMSVAEQAATDLRIHIRGNHLTLGEVAPRRFPAVFGEEGRTPIGQDRSGRRELADWLTRADHPLTARVMVNRVWLWHFGQGLVRSPDNYGRLGEPPTHPELLDWLARRFVADGWSIKALHRRIMLSATYGMSTHYDATAAEADPENRLRWRFDRRRLDAESIRDALLAVTGAFNPAMGGTILNVKNHAYVNNTGSAQSVDLYDVNIRSVYLPVIRSGVFPVFQAFDFADPSTSIGQRTETTVAPQALFMLNGRLVARTSSAWSARLLTRSDLDDAGRVALVYETAYGRPPEPREVRRVLDYLERLGPALASEGVPESERPARAWAMVVQAILAASEFITID